MPAWASNPGVLAAIHPVIHSSSQPHILPFIQSPIPESNHLSFQPANSTKTSNSHRQLKIPACYLFSIHSKTAHMLINMQSGNRGATFNFGVEPTVLRSAKKCPHCGQVLHWYELNASWRQKWLHLLGLLCIWQPMFPEHRSQSR